MERSGLASGLGSLGDAPRPSLILTFERLPKVALDRFCGRIAAIEALPEPPRVTVEKTAPPGAVFSVGVTFGGHALRLLGFASPVAREMLERTVGSAWIPDEQKRAVERHAAHIVCSHESGSENPVEQHIALYKVAWGFAEAGLTGVLNEHAWTCQPAEALPKLVSREALARFRQSVPLLVWTGLVKVPHARGLWFITRGHHLFGFPDFAYLASGDSEGEAVVAMLRTVVAHMQTTGETVGPGDTIPLNEREILRFEELPAYLGLPHGEGRVLEIERTTPSGLDVG